MATLIVGISAGIASACWAVSWAIVRCTAARVTGRLAQQALEECPPSQRAGILRAAAELAGKVSADRAPGKSVTLFSIGRRRDG